VTCFGSAEWALGVAATTTGQLDAAIDHFTRAVDANVRLGHRPMTMIALAELADALSARAAAGDHARAAAAWRRAAELGDEIGVRDRADEWRSRADSSTHDVVEPDAGVLRQDGDQWVVLAGDRCAITPDLVGVRYLGTLLTHPGAEISAVELCGGVAGIDAGAHEVVDRTTIDAYRRRVVELDAALDAAKAADDRRRARRLGEEREALRAELASVLAVSGRSRRFVDSAERARTAVRKAIARAIDAIAESDEAIGSELRATISTGRSCTYAPDPHRPRRWSVRRAS
jgi:tetratricopeptide (TPR) repeat protein